MLCTASELKGYALEAVDGRLGTCKDFLFDDRDWALRYLVVDTGRKVLVSPLFLEAPRHVEKALPVTLTKGEVEHSPPLDEHAPVSRRRELQYLDFYHLPYYWPGTGLWGAYRTPQALRLAWEKAPETLDRTPGREDRCLRSTEEVAGYRIPATDEEVGHVEDFVVEEETWVVRYLVVDTRNWLPGRKVLVAPSWVRAVDWAKEEAAVDLPSEAIRESPEWDPGRPLNRHYETQLYGFYGKPPYWR
ncbi:MAG: PRC-barrel domain-containing protein [Thermodesulfobacteriota bacterium]